MRFAVVVLVVVLIARCAGLAVAQTTQAAPTTAPLADDIRTWFKQLSDPSPDVRDRARIRLMTMSRARLPELRRVVADARPLGAAQAVELRQIVEHVFLSGEPYFAEQPGRGFMGVEMTVVSVPESEAESNQAPAAADDRRDQRVMVTSCIPGFAAFPFLRTGDIVLSVVGSSVPLTRSEMLGQAISGVSPGQTVELEIQRAGKVMRVPIRLSRRPFALRENLKAEKERFIGERGDAAAEYWQKQFESLLDPQPL